MYVCKVMTVRGYSLVMYGNEIQSTELAVDLSNELRDLMLKTRGVGEGGRGDLDQDDVSNPLGVCSEEAGECAQLI